MPKLTNYAFDVPLMAAVRVDARSRDSAELLLTQALEAADANLGAWPDGSPITAEVSLSGEPRLYEIDGEETQEAHALDALLAILPERLHEPVRALNAERTKDDVEEIAMSLTLAASLVGRACAHFSHLTGLDPAKESDELIAKKHETMMSLLAVLVQAEPQECGKIVRDILSDSIAQLLAEKFARRSSSSN